MYRTVQNSSDAQDLQTDINYRAVPRIFMGGFFLPKYGLLRVILSECL